MGAKGNYAHGTRFLIVLLLSGGAVGSAWAAPPGRYLAADRIRAAVGLLVSGGKKMVRPDAAPPGVRR